MTGKKPTMKNTKKEIMSYMEENKIPCKKSMTKKELLAKVSGKKEKQDKPEIGEPEVDMQKFRDMAAKMHKRRKKTRAKQFATALVIVIIIAVVVYLLTAG